jgi:3-oxoacyl-[acyl-carrier-protein] synthase-3
MPFDFEQATGIHSRFVCTGEEDALTLATSAAQSCLKRSSMSASDLDLVVSCSISKFGNGSSHHFEPPLSSIIKRTIGAHRAANFDLSNACGGLVTGLIVIDNLLRTGAIRAGMAVSGEFISSIAFNAASKWPNGQSEHLASLTVGDAGAAVILVRDGGLADRIYGWSITTHAEFSDLCIGRLDGDAPGGRMISDAFALHRLAIPRMVPVLSAALEAAGVGIRELDFAIPHQTSKQAVEVGHAYLNRILGPTATEPVCYVSEIGNTASTSHFVALELLIKSGRLVGGQKIALLAYGAGLCLGAVILSVSNALIANVRKV